MSYESSALTSLVVGSRVSPQHYFLEFPCRGVFHWPWLLSSLTSPSPPILSSALLQLPHHCHALDLVIAVNCNLSGIPMSITLFNHLSLQLPSSNPQPRRFFSPPTLPHFPRPSTPHVLSFILVKLPSLDFVACSYNHSMHTCSSPWQIPTLDRSNSPSILPAWVPLQLNMGEFKK